MEVKGCNGRTIWLATVEHEDGEPTYAAFTSRELAEEWIDSLDCVFVNADWRQVYVDPDKDDRTYH